CKNPKHWALTYDDGPYKYDENFLAFLKTQNVKATFFVNGDNVLDITSDKGKRIIKSIIDQGHEIGSHTWSHANLEELSESGLKSEITKLENALVSIIGKKPAFIRPPYGDGDDNKTVQKNLQKLGYTGIIMWNVDTKDWDNKGNVDYALSKFKEKIGNGIISLNHVYYDEISETKLVNLAKKEIEYMKSQGYTPVTVSECIGLKPYQ
ncbi:carbohydrate esterase family 4 protein, partial [Piromyces sp. E2]